MHNFNSEMGQAALKREKRSQPKLDKTLELDC